MNSVSHVTSCSPLPLNKIDEDYLTSRVKEYVLRVIDERVNANETHKRYLDENMENINGIIGVISTSLIEGKKIIQAKNSRKLDAFEQIIENVNEFCVKVIFKYFFPKAGDTHGRPLICAEEIVDTTVKSNIDHKKMITEEVTIGVSKIVIGHLKFENGFEKRLEKKCSGMINRTRLIDMKQYEMYCAKQAELIAITQKCLIIAERKKCAINDVSDKDILEFDNEQSKIADDIMLELIQEEEVKKKTPVKKKKKPTAKPIVVSAPKPPKVETRKKVARKVKQSPNNHISAFYQVKVREDSRVTKRWEERDADKIRLFEDKDKDGKIIQRYLHLERAEIKKQRAFHYLPGIEKLLQNRVYTFPTDKGCGLYAEITRKTERYIGTVYIGVGAQDHVVYHKYFKENDFADTNICSQYTDKEDSFASNEEKGWEHTAKQIFEVDDEGVLKVTFPEEKHSIRIFPIRKDLL